MPPNHRQDASPSYAYTSNKNAPKYSPLRNPNPGANNIPMSYAGPPSQAEINRNKGRNLHTNAYDNDRNRPQEYNRTLDYESGGGMARGGAGGIVLSYSPPRERANNNKKPPQQR